MKLPRILFILPARGASGGANSVVQEATDLRALGCKTGIMVNTRNVTAFKANYPALDGAGIKLLAYGNAVELGKQVGGYDVAVATTNGSVAELADALAGPPKASIRPAYYVQDYEPLFYEPDTAAWQVAYQSYTRIPGCLLFAKTNWLCDTVYRNHGVRVEKVRPSLDHGIFFPDLSRSDKTLSIVAMLRPQTPRRAPLRTARVLAMLADRLGERVTFTVFGCSPDHLRAAGIRLPERVNDLGLLRRDEVPNLLRASDMFLDLSDFQAFGRTGLESMACGCVPLVPSLGGTDEYARHGRNAFVVDTRSDDAIIDAVEAFCALSERERSDLRLRGLATAAEFSARRAALDELNLFRQVIG